MPIFKRENKVVLFIHIPKAAGSSIEKIAVNSGWTESFSIRGKSLNDISYFKASPQHLHAEVLNALFYLNDFCSVFTVVRNPFDRFKSEYYWQLSQGITSDTVEEWIKNTFKGYSENPYIYDNHIRPQIEFIQNIENIEIFKLEEYGIKKAQMIFENKTSSIKLKSRIKRIFLRPYHEKRSIKDPVIETKFRQNYEKIVEFYYSDYERFVYDIKCTI